MTFFFLSREAHFWKWPWDLSEHAPAECMSWTSMDHPSRDIPQGTQDLREEEGNSEVERRGDPSLRKLLFDLFCISFSKWHNHFPEQMVEMFERGGNRRAIEELE